MNSLEENVKTIKISTKTYERLIYFKDVFNKEYKQLFTIDKNVETIEDLINYLLDIAEEEIGSYYDVSAANIMRE